LSEVGFLAAKTGKRFGSQMRSEVGFSSETFSSPPPVLLGTIFLIDSICSELLKRSLEISQ
jgi:hypothetical protein